MEISALLENFKEIDLSLILLIIHVFGVALGVGGASVSDFLFFKSIKRKLISEDDFSSLMTTSKVVWIGTYALLLSGLAIFLLILLERGSIPMLGSPRWQAKITWVGVIVANGFYFKTIIFSKIKSLVGQKLSLDNVGRTMGHLAISGFISIFTWYSVVIITLLPRSFRPPYTLLMGAYLLVLICGIKISHIILKKKMSAERLSH